MKVANNVDLNSARLLNSNGLTDASGNPVSGSGTAGVDAFTATTASFTQPAVSSTVSVSVGNTAWMGTGQYLFVVGGGYYTVSGVTNATTVVLTNLGYAGNAAAAATVAAGVKVSPGGVAGNARLALNTAQTWPYVVAAGDLYGVIRTSTASNANLTVNTGTAGDWVQVYQYAAGIITVVAGTGVTLRSRLGLVKTGGQYARITLFWISNTEVSVEGDVG